MTLRQKVQYAAGIGQRWNRAFAVAKESFCLHATANDLHKLTKDKGIQREAMRPWKEMYPKLAQESDARYT
jgi:hypothetical protein